MNDRIRDQERRGEGWREEGSRRDYERDRFSDIDRGNRFNGQDRDDYRFGDQNRGNYQGMGREEQERYRYDDDRYRREEGMGSQQYGQGGYGQRYGQGNAGQERFGQEGSGAERYGQDRWGQGSQQGRPGQSNQWGSQQGRSGQEDQRGMGQPYGMTHWPYDSEARSNQQMPGMGESHWGKGPKGYQKNDERVKEEVSEKLMQDHSVDASEIEVEVQSGEVTLTGTVKDRQQKRQAEDCIEGVSGVKHVNNQLRIGAQSGSGQTSQTQSKGQGNQTNQDNAERSRAKS